MTSSLVSRRALIAGGVALGIGVPRSDRLITPSPSVDQHPAPTTPFAMTGGAVAFVVAMEDELRHLLAEVTVTGEERAGPWTVLALERNGQQLLAMHSGIGMVNAAACADRLLSMHLPRAVLNFGSAGAHARSVFPGDVVIGSATVNQGLLVILPDGTVLYPETSSAAYGEDMPSGIIACDPALLALAQDSAAAWMPPAWPRDLPWPAEMPRREPLVQTGVVASSDIWTQSPERIGSVHDALHSLCEDMEAAAINQVCHRYGVPFLTIKDISNNELWAASDMQSGEPATSEEEVGRRSAALMIRLFDRLPR